MTDTKNSGSSAPDKLEDAPEIKTESKSEIKRKEIQKEAAAQKETVKQTPKESPAKKAVNKTYEYKLDLYNIRGEIRPSFSKELVRTSSAQYGDIIRAIPVNRWSTMDQIVESYWELERRFNLDMGRSRKKIEAAVNELVDWSIIITR